MSEVAPSVVVQTPTQGVDPRVALATSIHAAPGVYSVLVGSGMSRAAGIKTGWEIVQDLIRRIALAEGLDPGLVEEHPEQWWESTGRPEPRFDALLEALGNTAASRRSLIRRYFDRANEEGDPIRPTEGHRALARMVAAGRVKTIITTNFDHLIERAIEEEGISPQVIVTPGEIGGMIPLAHAPATVIKVSGDYTRPGLRITRDELATYPYPLRRLISRVFDEYGLVVVGWSADWDGALVEALSATRSRRYPTYWTTLRGHLRESAGRVVALREATVVNTDGADEFFVDITERIANLDRVAARKGRPRRLPVPLRRPESSGAPAGWAAKPLLWLKVAASLAPAPDEDRGMIRQPDREEIKRSLMTSPLTARLRQLSEYRPASALAEREPPPYNVLGLWELLADGFQTASHAAFRIGGDASAGISAILSVGDYGGYPPSGSVFVELDIGFSIESKLLLHQVGQVLRDGLVLVTATIPDAIGDFLPPDAQPATVEIHIVAPTDDGRVTRQNDPGLRVDLGPLGSSTRDLASSWSFAASVSQPFETRSAAEFVVQALERIVLDAGITEPDRGLAELRRALAP